MNHCHDLSLNATETPATKENRKRKREEIVEGIEEYLNGETTISKQTKSPKKGINSGPSSPSQKDNEGIGRIVGLEAVTSTQQQYLVGMNYSYFNVVIFF